MLYFVCTLPNIYCMYAHMHSRFNCLRTHLWVCVCVCVCVNCLWSSICTNSENYCWGGLTHSLMACVCVCVCVCGSRSTLFVESLTANLKRTHRTFLFINRWKHVCLRSACKWHVLSVKRETSELYLLLCWLICSVIWIIRQQMSTNGPVYSSCELVTAGRVAAVQTTALTSSVTLPFSRTPRCGSLHIKYHVEVESPAKAVTSAGKEWKMERVFS